jgi:hypothetical protein
MDDPIALEAISAAITANNLHPTTTEINLKAFPPVSQPILRAFDINGDGFVDVHEVRIITPATSPHPSLVSFSFWHTHAHIIAHSHIHTLTRILGAISDSWSLRSLLKPPKPSRPAGTSANPPSNLLTNRCFFRGFLSQYRA